MRLQVRDKLERDYVNGLDFLNHKCVYLCVCFQISDYTMLPDTAALSEQLRVCLQEGDENPRDFTKLFDMSLYQMDTTALPSVIKSAAVISFPFHSCSFPFPFPFHITHFLFVLKSRWD